MRKHKNIRYAAGFLLCASLVTGLTGIAAYAEDFSAEPVDALEGFDWADFEEVESAGPAAGGTEEVSDGMTEEGTPQEIFGEQAEPGNALAALEELPEENPAEADDARMELLEEARKETGLTYTGEPQELLEVSEEGKELGYLYSLDGETYGTEVPTGTDAGTYTVYIKTADDAESVVQTVAIAKADVVFTPPAAIQE